MMMLIMLTGMNGIVGGNGDAYGRYVERRVTVRLETKHSELHRGSIPSQAAAQKKPRIC